MVDGWYFGDEIFFGNPETTRGFPVLALQRMPLVMSTLSERVSMIV